MTFPKYPEYKDSGVEWLGEVPAHWSLKPLKAIATFAGGATPSRDTLSYWNGDIPWVSPKDMKSEVVSATQDRITTEGLASCAATLQPPGCVLVVVRSGILKHTIPVAINLIPVAVNQDIKSIAFRRGTCDSRFFMRWVQGLNGSLRLAWLKHGATVESIEHEYLASTMLPLPPTDEQSSILAFLDHETAKIDALVDEQKRLIELLKEKRQAVISHAVTKGLDPDVPMKDSGVEWLGEVPAHWEVLPIKYVVQSMEQGWSPQCENRIADDDEFGILKVGCVNGGQFKPEENKALPSDLPPDPNLSIRAGDLLISRANTRDLVGSAAVALADYSNLLLCDKLYRLRLDDARCLPRFLSFYLGTRVARGRLELEATGASSSMLNIGQATVRDLVFPAPPVDEQQRIVAFIDDQLRRSDKLVAEAKQAVALLQERRATLISAAVTGKIDVRGWRSPTAEQQEWPQAAEEHPVYG